MPVKGCARISNIGTTSTLHDPGGHRIEYHLPTGKMMGDCVQERLLSSHPLLHAAEGQMSREAVSNATAAAWLALS